MTPLSPIFLGLWGVMTVIGVIAGNVMSAKEAQENDKLPSAERNHSTLPLALYILISLGWIPVIIEITGVGLNR